jgi:tRNA-specific 2-thiouridylase
VRLEPDRGRVVVGPKAALAVLAAELESLNLLGGPSDRELAVKVRSMARPAPARLAGDTVRFVSPEYGVAPGQAAVLYEGSRVLGGGWIRSTVAAELEAA